MQSHQDVTNAMNHHMQTRLSVTDSRTILIILAGYLILWPSAALVGESPSKISVPVAPVYAKLKDLHVHTPIVTAGKPSAVIVTPTSRRYHQTAAAIQAAIKRSTGVLLPIVPDTAPGAILPPQSHLIILGNRSTNRTLRELYDRYYTLLDLRYPGRGGYVVRSLHNPYANVKNVILVGGSDDAGVKAAAETLVTIITKIEERKNGFTLGWIMRIKLGDGIKIPRYPSDFETWEASLRYGSIGYFGWNSISKHMAMYYMTGNEFHAREAMRLAFPNKQALKEITEIDQERIEDKRAPLSGPYHYNNHMMILFWDLIEESPVFTDAQRLRVTNAFARQLEHNDWSMQSAYRLTSSPAHVGSRHGQWGAISLYWLGRYFKKYYPGPVWDQAVRGATLHFSSLHRHAWVAGEKDNLYWYSTGLAPVLTYMILTGDQKPQQNGVLAKLLRTQEILLSGEPHDANLGSASISYLHKAAYLTGDGRWLTYLRSTGIDTNIFRLGQSFWPEDTIKPGFPRDMIGAWRINPLPKSLWKSRASGLAYKESFQFGSFRSRPGAAGDYILLDGFNGAARNPYHTFAILHLRINGTTLLKGYHNQVLTSADGMVEPRVPMDAALKYRGVLGRTAMAVGEVPNAPFASWRRSLILRIGRYALIVDDVRFRASSDNMRLKTMWQSMGGHWTPEKNRIDFRIKDSPPPGWIVAKAIKSPCTSGPKNGGGIKALNSYDLILLKAKEPGEWLQMTFRLDKAVTGDLFVQLVNYKDRGMVKIFLDGQVVLKRINHYAEDVEHKTVALGHHALAAGKHRIRIQSTALGPARRCLIGFTGISLRPEGARDKPLTARGSYALMPGDLTAASGSSVVTMNWSGPVRQNDRRCLFYLLVQVAETGNSAPGCYRVAPNAAALALPEPGLAVVGAYQGLNAETAILSAGHLYAHALKLCAVGAPLVAADHALELDWEFATGILALTAPQTSVIRLALRSPDNLRLDGNPMTANVDTGGMTAITIPTGTHELQAATPNPDLLIKVRAQLQSLLRQGREQRTDTRAKAARPTIRPRYPTLPVVATIDIGQPLSLFVPHTTAEGKTMIVAVGGRTAHLLAPDGTVLRKLLADARIRVVRYWAEPNLLLLGCVDEKVIAFDRNGNRKWTFTSVMDPAVFRAGKQYWFKSAPGHEGIHGLYTGVFLDNKTQCFVGSACTLEIIDQNGQLVKRMPIFWGPGREFTLIDGPDKSINLLIARWPCGTDLLAVLNNKTLKVRKGFYKVPRGHTTVGGWYAQNRVATIIADLDGDGKKELVSPTNGTWNRVTVYSLAGKPIANAQFGPGKNKYPRANIRDFAVADLDGNGKQEIVVGIAANLVVALDHQCGRLWSRHIDSPPMRLGCAVPAEGGRLWTVVGCMDGTVLALDAKGKVIRSRQTNGRIIGLKIVCPQGRPLAVVGTAKGRVVVMELR